MFRLARTRPSMEHLEHPAKLQVFVAVVTQTRPKASLFVRTEHLEHTEHLARMTETGTNPVSNARETLAGIGAVLNTC